MIHINHLLKIHYLSLHTYLHTINCCLIIIPSAYERASKECKCSGNWGVDGSASSYLGGNTGGCTTCIWSNNLVINFISKRSSVIWVKSLSINIETYAMSGILILVPDIPVTLILDQLSLIHLNIQQMVLICTSSS